MPAPRLVIDDRRAQRRAVCIALLVMAAGCGPGDPLAKARALQEKQDFAASIDPLREFLAVQPDHPEANYRYGHALSATGQGARAKWALRKAQESPEWFEASSWVLAEALVNTGEHEEAAAVCTALIEHGADEVRALILRARAYMFSRRRYEDSLADAERVLELDPENLDALVPQAVALLALDRVDEAAEVIADLEGRYRDDSLGLHGSVGLCLARATFALEKGDRPAAAERYDDCLEHFPSAGELVVDAVAFFDSEGQPERSRAILERALEEDPAKLDLRVRLVMRLRAEGKVEEAEALLRKGAEEVDAPVEAAEAWAALGAFKVEQGEYEEGVEAFAAARRLDRTGSDTLRFAHADSLVLAGRYDDALRVARGLNVPAYRELIEGRVALERGEARVALQRFEQAFTLWPNNPYARYYAAVAAEELGDFDRAVAEYRAAMRVDPAATDAYLRLARLHEAAGRDGYALAALRVRPGNRPREDEAALLELRLITREAGAGVAPPRLRAEGRGVAWSERVAAIARGLADREGDEEAAAGYVRRLQDLDFGNPEHREAAAAWVEAVAASGALAEAKRRVEAELSAHPDASWLHALHARVLEMGGAPAEEIGAACERALEADPDEVWALRWLAERRLGEGAATDALELAERALRVDAGAAEFERIAAAALVLDGRVEEAERRLSRVLRDQPWDAETNLALAELAAEQLGDPARARALARRAAYFRAGERAKSLLERLEARAAAETAKPG